MEFPIISQQSTLINREQIFKFTFDQIPSLDIIKASFINHHSIREGLIANQDSNVQILRLYLTATIHIYNLNSFN